MTELVHNYVGGRWTPSSGAETLPVTNPASGEEIGRTPLSTQSCTVLSETPSSLAASRVLHSSVASFICSVPSHGRLKRFHYCHI